MPSTIPFALTLTILLSIATSLAAQSPPTIAPADRLFMASQIYHIVSTFFPGLAQQKFDAAYKQYLATILRTDDRLHGLRRRAPRRPFLVL